jgi:hypothetical protein
MSRSYSNLDDKTYIISAFKEDKAKLLEWFKYLQNKHAAIYRSYDKNRGRILLIDDIDNIVQESTILITCGPCRNVYQNIVSVYIIFTPTDLNVNKLDLSFSAEFIITNNCADIEHVLVNALEYYDNRYSTKKQLPFIAMLFIGCLVFMITIYQTRNNYQCTIVYGTILILYFIMFYRNAKRYIMLHRRCPTAPNLI